MKKQRIAFFLGLVWLIGIVAVFSFPPPSKLRTETNSSSAELKGISTPDLVFSLVDHSPEVPAFKASLGIADLKNTDWSVAFVPSFLQYLSPSFFTKSKALFDVLTTFFYFFYTW